MRYNVKNNGTDVITVYDSDGKAFILKRNQACNMDRKPEGVASLIVEEIKDRSPEIKETKTKKRVI